MTYCYQPYYCEENVWQLCGHPEFADLFRKVVFITNRTRTCPIWKMRAARPLEPVIWDYHVIMLCQNPDWRIYDLDSSLAFGVMAETYLAQCFQPVAARFAPMFRVIDAETFRARFASDRSHMRDAHGHLHPPPAWPPIGVDPHNLHRFLDLESAFLGELMDLDGMRRLVRGRGSRA